MVAGQVMSPFDVSMRQSALITAGAAPLGGASGSAERFDGWNDGGGPPASPPPPSPPSEPSPPGLTLPAPESRSAFPESMGGGEPLSGTSCWPPPSFGAVAQ